MKIIPYKLAASFLHLVLFAWCFLMPSSLFSFLPLGLLNHFPNRYFVETGTWEGHGIIAAILARCFPEIHSIELSEAYYHKAVTAFSDSPFIHVWQGNSGEKLAEVIRNIEEPITFWLDAHYSGPGTAKGSQNNPILQELEAIKNHPIKTHTILIDDVRLFGTEEFDFISLETIVNKIKEINSAYSIEFVDGGPGFVKDILVAKIR